MTSGKCPLACDVRESNIV
uniref:Uncharacterized protein n=1 Tax=Anguilla anguilla TaxID=7936 RepID=A0A0E9SX36_ANGAN